MGKRVNFADLAQEAVLEIVSDEGDNGVITSGAPYTARLEQLAHYPGNPRESLTELDELADSLRERGQIQPCAVVTRNAYLRLRPDHADRIGSAEYVVIAGNRRLAAAGAAGLAELDIVVKDHLAEQAAVLIEAALIENVQRADLKPMEEARSLKALLDVHGSQRQVATRLGKTQAWVSQRLSLLGLVPELQEALEAGELRVEDARRLGRLTPEQQVVGDNGVITQRPAKALPANNVTPQLVIPSTNPEVIAETLFQRLRPAEFQRLLQLLTEKL